MGIENFPASLQPIVQEGFLARAFMDSLQSELTYRAIADRIKFPNKIGETLTMTRPGLKAPVTTNINPGSNTNLDNGLTPSAWTVEQFTLSVNMYGDTIDLNRVTQAVGIESQFLQNARVNGIQAAQSIDRQANNALYGSYLGGNTRVTTALGAPATTIHVDDIRGFRAAFVGNVNNEANIVAGNSGSYQPISSGNPLTVTIGADVYTVIGFTPDGTNISGLASYGGISGTLTTTTNVTTSDGALNQPVVSAVAPVVIRPNNRASTAALVSGDYMTMVSCALEAAAVLKSNRVPMVNGCYNVYTDYQQMVGLFRDPDFKLLYQGQADNATYVKGQVVELLGLRFISTSESPQQTLNGNAIHRALVCGQGALVEGDFTQTGYQEEADLAQDGLIEMVDDIAMITREPLDRLKQIIGQSWCWIGGFVVPTDITANTTIIPTATNSALKRAVVIESL
jgi:hypothetical protein